MSTPATPASKTRSWELPFAGGRHGVPDHRRVRHLHDFRCGLSVLRWKEPSGPTPMQCLKRPSSTLSVCSPAA